MLLFNSTSNIIVYLYSYMFLYNVTLFVLLISIVTNLLPKNKTLFSMSSLSFDPSLLLIITICLFSMAGVPPFIGFFSKLFILNIILNAGLFLLYFLLFILLFAGLYFYMQNMRLLHSSKLTNSNKPYSNNERIALIPLYISIYILIVLISGLSYIDDILLYFSWLNI